MRLLLLSVEFPPGPGGLGTLAFQLACGLQRLGWQVTAATPQTHAAQAEIEHFNAAQPFPIIQLPFFGPSPLEGFQRLIRLYGLARGARADILLGVGRESAFLGSFLAQLTGLPLALVTAGSEFGGIPLRGFPFGGIRRPLTAWAYHQADLVIPISQYAAGLVTEQGVSSERQQVIPCGADEESFRPGLPVADLRRQLELEGRRVLLTVGRLTARKGQEVVLQALPAVLKAVPQAVYLMVGLPADQVRLQAQAQALRIAEHVRFMGIVPQAQLPRYYNLADLFVLLSRPDRGQVEGFGIAVVEAALCGVPAVVSRHGGLPETVLPGETGLVVPPGDPQAAAQAILRLLADEPLRQGMGAQASQYALQHMTWVKVALAYSRALRQLLAGPMSN